MSGVEDIATGAAMLVYVSICFGFALAADHEKQPFIGGSVLALLWPMVVMVGVGVKLYYWSRTRRPLP